MFKRGLAVAWALLCAAVPGGATAQSNIPSPTLDAIRARGALACGINPGVAGFSLPDSRDQTVNRHGWNPSYGLGREKVTNVSYNLELPLQDDLRFYSFSTASYMETTKVTGNYRPNEITSLAGDPNTPYPDAPQSPGRPGHCPLAGG